MIKNIFIFLTFILLSFYTFTLPVKAATIMPLGDSITAGFYPCYLAQMLKAESSLVGPNDPIYCAGSGAKYGGYTGYNTQDILNNQSWTGFGPTYVLIHLGTNDVSSGWLTSDMTIERLKKIIDLLPSSNIKLSKIIPLIGIGYDVVPLNNKIHNYNWDYRVNVIDMYSGFPTNFLSDGVHPNEDGGKFIAKRFCEALGADICNPNVELKPLSGGSAGTTTTTTTSGNTKLAKLVPNEKVPDQCKVIGVNFAVESSVVGEDNYDKAVENGMGWVLVIADKGRQEATTVAVNRALARGLKPIIRIGSGHDTFGFSKEPGDWLEFLNNVAAKATGTFYAIAGPNEPDAEDWIVGHSYEIGTDGTPNMTVLNDLGGVLAEYMNYMTNNVKSPKIKLLSPAFNLSSWSGEYIIKAMIDNGANFGGLWGYSGNAYSLHDWEYYGQSPIDDLEIQIKKLKNSSLGYTLPDKKIVLTETGNTKQDMRQLAVDIKNFKNNKYGIEGALLFNAFDTNKWGWSHFAIKNFEEILGSECIQKAKPKPDLSKFLPPATIPCGQTVDPEFHPDRPYPFNPCDPLIPSGKTNAKDIPEPKDKKDYTTFACGNTLTPIKTSYFDPYGDETPPGMYCEKKGLEVTCWRSEDFDITIDLSKANLGIISNTQDKDLTDLQKVNDYLSWYLSGSYRAGQAPDIQRMINFSGPLQKLLPRSFLTTAQKTVSETVGTEVHKYKSIFSNTALQNILKDIPYTSLEDAVGEYTISVYPPGEPGNPQDLNVLGPKDPFNRPGSELKLTIKSAEKAKK